MQTEVRVSAQRSASMGLLTQEYGGAVAEVSEATNANQCHLQMKRMMSQMKKMEVQI